MQIEHSNTTFVKVKSFCKSPPKSPITIQIQHLLKLNYFWYFLLKYNHSIQIQHLLKLNQQIHEYVWEARLIQIQHLLKLNEGLANPLTLSPNNSNTTFVKVKFSWLSLEELNKA